MVLLNDTFWNIAHLNLCEEISAMKIWHAEILHFSLTFHHYSCNSNVFEIRNSNLLLFHKLHQRNIYKNKCDHLYQCTLSFSSFVGHNCIVVASWIIFLFEGLQSVKILLVLPKLSKLNLEWNGFYFLWWS